MFERSLQSGPRSRKKIAWIAASVVLHAIVGGFFLVLSFWEIHEIRRPSHGVAMASSLALPPPGGSRSKADEPKRVVRKEKHHIVKDPRQPHKLSDEKQVASSAQFANLSDADSGGDATGTGGAGDVGGPGTGNGPSLGIGLETCLDSSACTPPSLPIAPPDDPAPRAVPSATLREMHRIAGEEKIRPQSSVQNEMARQGQQSLSAVILLCVSKSGAVSKQRVLKSSGYLEYDAKLVNRVQKWRYEPYLANGHPIAICTQLRFDYRQE